MYDVRCTTRFCEVWGVGRYGPGPLALQMLGDRFSSASLDPPNARVNCTLPLRKKQNSPVIRRAEKARRGSTARNRGRARLPTASLLITQEECRRHHADRLQRLRFARQVLCVLPVHECALDVSRPPEARQDFSRMDQTVCLKAIQQCSCAQATAHTMTQGPIIAVVDILRDVPFQASFSQIQLLCITWVQVVQEATYQQHCF